MTRYYLIGCNVVRPECERLLAELPTAVDCHWVEQGLHDRPELLKQELHKLVTAAPAGYDAVLLGFGLCSNCTLELAAPAGTPLVIPRVHDCISFYLGGAAAYYTEYDREPGTYWFARGFMHREDADRPNPGVLGYAPGGEELSPTKYAQMRQEYVEQYGEENADYLMETLVDSWKAKYKRAVLLTWDYPEAAADRERVKAFAAQYHWAYEERSADLRLLRMLLCGDWPDQEFIVLPPGRSLAASNDRQVFRPAAG